MTEHDRTDTDLEALFAAERREAPDLPADLSARILADAARVQLQLRPQRMQTPPAWRRLLDGVGGWRGCAGLATACAAGIWVGFAAPQFLPDPVQFLQGAELSAFEGDDLLLALSED